MTGGGLLIGLLSHESVNDPTINAIGGGIIGLAIIVLVYEITMTGFALMKDIDHRQRLAVVSTIIMIILFIKVA